MKRNHLLGLIVLAVLAGVFLATFQDASTYQTFPTAEGQMGEECVVIGTLDLNDSITFNKDKRSEEYTSELQSLMRISYAVFCLKKKKK